MLRTLSRSTPIPATPDLTGIPKEVSLKIWEYSDPLDRRNVAFTCKKLYVLWGDNIQWNTYALLWPNKLSAEDLKSAALGEVMKFFFNMPAVRSHQDWVNYVAYMAKNKNKPDGKLPTDYVTLKKEIRDYMAAGDYEKAVFVFRNIKQAIAIILNKKSFHESLTGDELCGLVKGYPAGVVTLLTRDEFIGENGKIGVAQIKKLAEEHWIANIMMIGSSKLQDKMGALDRGKEPQTSLAGTSLASSNISDSGNLLGLDDTLQGPDETRLDRCLKLIETKEDNCTTSAKIIKSFIKKVTMIILHSPRSKDKADQNRAIPIFNNFLKFKEIIKKFEALYQLSKEREVSLFKLYEYSEDTQGLCRDFLNDTDSKNNAKAVLNSA